MSWAFGRLLLGLTVFTCLRTIFQIISFVISRTSRKCSIADGLSTCRLFCSWFCLVFFCAGPECGAPARRRVPAELPGLPGVPGLPGGAGLQPLPQRGWPAAGECAAAPGGRCEVGHGSDNMAVGQNQWYHFGVGAPPILVHFSWDWDVYWGYGILTHGHILRVGV